MPLIGALAYPFLLKAFHGAVAVAAGKISVPAFALLALAVVWPMSGIVTANRLGALEGPSVQDVLAKRLALLAVAAAPIYTACGVLLYMAGDPISDIAIWLILWGTPIAWLLARYRGSEALPAAVISATVAPRLRVAHGVAAGAIVMLFLAIHIGNHLTGLLSEAAHRHYMDIFRTIYRARLVEPVVVLLFLFLVGSGMALLWGHTRQRADWFRTFQIASGAYLIFFVLGHMNSVFLYARIFAHIPTDWNFATGAPTGLVYDAWNIRLMPHYLLGVFFALSHLVSGARIVAIAHGIDCTRADRMASFGIAIAALIAVLIIFAMTGVHLA